MNYCAALFLCLAVFYARPCSPATVFSEDGKHAEEEILDQTTINILQKEVSDIGTTKTGPNRESEDSSSSKEVDLNIKSKNKSVSSESMESSSSESSEEIDKKKKIQKRSLDTKPDSVNLFGKNSNESVTKLNNDLGKSTPSIVDSPNSTLVIEYSDDDSSKKPTTPNTDSTITIDIQTTTESRSEGTTSISESETTTETETEQDITERDSETTTEAQVESKTEIRVNGTENEPEAVPATTPEINSEKTPETKLEAISDSSTESKPETTSELNPEASEETLEHSDNTESGSTTTTEETLEKTQFLSGENEDKSPTNISSIPSTEIKSSTSEQNSQKTMMEVAIDRVNKLSDQIRLVLMTYRKEGVVVLPGPSFFPDPMPMQDFKQSFSIGVMDFKNMRVFGLSNFTVEHINTDVDKMQVYILLHMKRLVILGNYTLRTFFSRAAGPFNVTLLDVDSEGVAEIQTASAGYLEAADSVMDMFTKDMKVDFKNLGFMGSMFQGMVSTVGDALFNSIKPQILERVNLVIRTDVNKKMKEFSTKFINKVNPVDLAFSEGRKYCRMQGYDPYHIRDHNFILGGLVYVNITEFWVEGLSRFYRVGNLSLSMDAGVIEVSAHVMTGKLTGHCHWSGQTFGILKYGKTNFTVDHLQVRAIVHQSLDIRKKPQLNDLDLELGWVKVTMDSPMAMSLMIEGIINAFPRLIRHIIVDTLEQPLKEKIQEILNKINVESVVDENLPRLDSFGL